EFPLAPRTPADVAVPHQLRAPEPARAGFTVVLGDLLRAPFAPASFDTIVTPWLIDILPERLERVAERVARLLKPNGRWINFGSVAFVSADPAEQLCAAEIGPQLAACGLPIERDRDDTLPYMRSPASRHSRTEQTYSFVARRAAEVRACQPLAALPSWALDVRQPIPQSAFLSAQALQQQVYGFVASLVDGRRSLADIAAHLVEKRLMTLDEALPAVRGFLLQLHEQGAQRRRW
ncbi:MAG: methyltransferase domain-containing protein, partial [Gammaproteobacteria bacterium]|nr:methyltransferase domain-containing protein [Gammaproteobacteria bacterium]